MQALARGPLVDPEEPDHALRVEDAAVADHGDRLAERDLEHLEKFAGVKEGDSIMGVDILDLPNVLFLTTEGKAVVVAAKDIPVLTGAGKGVKLVNVKNGEVALFRTVRKNEQVKVIDEKGKEKVIDTKEYGVMTRGSVGLKAVKAVKFA